MFCFLFIVFLLEILPCQIVNAGGAVAKNVKSVKVATSFSMSVSGHYYDFVIR